MLTNREIDDFLDMYKTDNMPDFNIEWPVMIKEMALFIKKHLYEPGLTAETIYERCNITDKDIAGKFSYYTGHTPKKYIQFHRIECAKLILKHTRLDQLPLIKIAMSLGYSSHSAFTRAFRKQTGLTPSQWLKEKKSREKSREKSRL